MLHHPAKSMIWIKSDNGRENRQNEVYQCIFFIHTIRTTRKLCWIYAGEMSILFRIRRAAILFRSLSKTVVVDDEGLQ
jgi:hypothetical protein